MLSEGAGRAPDHRPEYPPGRTPDAELARRWQRSGDAAAREELVCRYLPLARRLAHRWRRPNEAADDLEQVAALALVKGIDRFEPGRGSLASYLVPTILGELKRWFRDRGWAVRVPRDLQELALRVERTASRMSRANGRSPTPRELAGELGVTVEDVIEAQEAASAYRAVPLTQPGGDPGEADQERPDTRLAGEDPGYGRAEDRAVLGTLLDLLSAREREVLRLRFEEDLTQSEIGERIGVSQMQVSRIIRAALVKLQDAASA